MSSRPIVLGVCLGGLTLLSMPWVLPQPGGKDVQLSADDATRRAAATTAAAPSDMGWIGLMLSPEGGALKVSSLFPGGPAAFAGLKLGDVVTEINGKKVTTPETAAAAIESIAPGSTAAIKATRGKQNLKLTVTAGSLRDFHARYVGEMLSRDPRHPQYGEQHGVSAADLQVELIRRQFEQNQRLEYSINHLRSEVQELRKELQASKR
jgi:membrane-associated protease RseP (regulator of RpoE activity)